MTVAAELIVNVAGRDVGLATLLQKLQAQLQQTNAAGTRTASVLGGTLATGASRADRSILQLASAEAALQRASGQSAQAQQTLASALQGVDRSSIAAIRTQTQLARIQSQTANSFSQLSSAASQFGIALGAGAIAKGILDIGQMGATSISARDSFNNLAAAAGTTGDALLTKMHAAAAGTVSDTNLMVSSNTGLLLVGEKIATALPRLLEIARAAAKATGKDVSFLYDSLVLGISRGSPKIIDNAGITLDAASAMDTYARSIGKTADELTSSEQQQATLNAVLATGAGFIDKIGLSSDSAAVSMQQAAAAADNFKAALGERLAPAIKVVADGFTNLLGKGDLFAGASGGAEQAQATITAQAATYDAYVQRVSTANEQLRAEIGKTDPVFASIVKGLNTLSPAQFAYAQSLIATGVASTQAVTQAQALASVDAQLSEAQQFAARGSDELGASFAALQPKMLEVAAGGPAAQASVLELVDSMLTGTVTAPQFAAALEQLSQTTRLHTAAAADDANMLAQAAPIIQQVTSATLQNNDALVQQAEKTLASSIQTQQLSTLQATLASLGGQVSGGLLTAANAAAILAGQYNLASGEASRLIGLQAQLAGVARARETALNRDDLRGARDNAAAPKPLSIAFLEDQKKRTDDLAAAQGRLAGARGNDAGQIAALRKLQAGLNKDSAEFINLEAQIEGVGGKGRKRGGGAKLSDQQKLNNSLLADQESADDKRETLEQNHQKKLLDIESDFAKKSLEQQHANEVAKRQSKFSFYKSLSDMEKNLGKDGARIAKEANIAYEQAFQESQQLAQSGQQKLAADRLALRQRQIQEDVQAAGEIATALADKDKKAGRAEAARLQSLEQLRKDAQAEELKQLEAGGDTNVNARNDALNAEALANEEAQGKIGTAAEQAAQRKILAAQRSGKAITDENTLLTEQEATLNRIAAAKGGASGATAAPSAPGGAAPTGTPGAAPVDLGGAFEALRAAMEQMSAGISAVERATRDGARDVSSAVRSSGGLVR